MIRVLLCALVLLGGCLKKRADRSAALDPRVVEVDKRWEDRGLGGLEPLEALLSAEVGEPLASDPEWAWRQVRLIVAQGQSAEATPRVALQHYGRARERGMACLDEVPAFLQLREEKGLAAASTVLPPEYMGCAAWTSLAWARWLALFGGEAGALDIEGVEGMSAMVAESGGATFRPTALWAQAVVFAVRPAWLGADPDRSRALMRRVVRMAPTDRLRQWDMLNLVAVPSGDMELAEELAQSLRRAQATTPEDRAAVLMASSLDLTVTQPVRE